jgi:hypothetical protein
MNLLSLRSRVEAEISSYVYEHHPEALGTSLSTDFIEAERAKLRSCLVDPHWVTVAWHEFNDDNTITLRCVVVAEDGGSLVGFDPGHDDYILIWRDGADLKGFGIRSDTAIECFISR